MTAILIVENALNLLCSNFTKADPSRGGKENIFILVDAFSKFRQVFITPKQKASTMAKVIVDKWFYIYKISAHIQSDKGFYSKKRDYRTFVCNVYS